MTRRALAAALAAASLALTAALALVLAASGSAATAFPDCPPGTPAPAPPTVSATLVAPGSPARLVAGRPISIEYDDPALTVSVQQTIGPPGTVFDSAGDGGDFGTLTLPAAGAIPVTAKYFVLEGGTCVHSFTYTLNVDAGDLVTRKPGATREFSPRGGWTPRKLPLFGDVNTGRPAVGLVYDCDGAKAIVPLSLVLHEESALGRRPSATSPSVRLDVPDPCETRTRTASMPGARLWFVNTSSYANEGERFLAAQVVTKSPRRWWAEFAQGTRLLGSLRFYTAWKPQNGRFEKGWVMAPEAGFEKARCKRPSPFTGLGFRNWPLPRCARR